MPFKMIAAVLATAANLASQPSESTEQPVELTATVARLLLAAEGTDQREELVPAESAVPGDTLVFTTRFRNRGYQPANHLLIVNAVPASVLLTAASASKLNVSVDGGTHWGALRDLSVPTGEGQSRPAEPGDVTHIRWMIDHLSPGEGGEASYAALVR